MFAFSSTSIRITVQDANLLGYVPLILAVMVCVII